MPSQWINTFGLIVNMIGALLLFNWGLPQPRFQEGDALLLEGEESDQRAMETREEKERYTRISKAGLALLFFGFALQLVANWL